MANKVVRIVKTITQFIRIIHHNVVLHIFHNQAHDIGHTPRYRSPIVTNDGAVEQPGAIIINIDIEASIDTNNEMYGDGLRIFPSQNGKCFQV